VDVVGVDVVLDNVLVDPKNRVQEDLIFSPKFDLQ
jgi:hypothetical protein